MRQVASNRTMVERSPSDEELMARLAAGSRDALGPLHGRYASLVFDVAARSLGRASAEEIVQEVFVAVGRKAVTFDPARGAFRPWVLGIAHLRVINELRRRGRRPRIEADPEGHYVGSAPEPGPGAAEAAWADHRREIVRAAVEALPPPQRQALSLAFLEDLTHQQIADFLDLPLGTAKGRIRTGLQSLRGRLAPLLAAGLLVVGLIAAALVRDGMWKADIRREEAALRLVTSSDVAPRRLTAAPGTPAETHGQYRARPGVAMAVTTISRMRPAPAGRIHRAWALFDGRWHLLGDVRPDAGGADLLLSEGPHLAAPPTALKVTLEPTAPSTEPTGPTVIACPSP
ncbi:RNA polymerase sigma factor [Paludisphaera mucosa]|uniref:Sigma-70 family RNA polymerase sigma factor n=1 Tax=Paludisphaera mucosa TaxID=3030827 RepID=A0ABT6F4R9_9BACT|nr:sigma-70 family RNA polymerase sigma factor [Paludisphaera mucosa]MDG3002395.1 sigma-70 family RNA polymerase sigma factor [Paludisphaera mucosa]